LTSGYSLSAKASDCYCLIPIYTNHLNLGFSKGTLLEDPHQLLKGTGKWMRHIPVRQKTDYRNPEVKTLILNAVNFTRENMKNKECKTGEIISKIKF